MAIKNQALTINFLAWDTSANTGKTGDSGNFTLRLIGDGGAPGAPTNAGSITEPDSTNLPGVYEITLTAAEMNYNFVTFGGISSTSDIIIIPQFFVTEQAGLATIDTVVDAIKAVTDNLPDGGALSTIDNNVDAIKAITDNLPDSGALTSLQNMAVQKASALSNIVFLMKDSAGAVVTGATVTAEISKDGGALASMSNSVSEIGNGLYKVDATALEMTADVVTLRFTASGAVATNLVFFTQTI